MAFLVLIIGAVILVAAVRNTHGQLMSAIKQDVPAYALWGAAIFGVAMIGFVPGLKPVSRGLLALLVLVIILANYRNLLASFQGVAFGAEAQAAQGSQAAAGGAVTPGDNSRLLASLGTLLGDINAGGNGDYSDFFGGSPSTASQAQALAAATAAEDAAFKSGRTAAPTEVSEAVVGGANPIKAGIAKLVQIVTDPFNAPVTGGSSPVTAADPFGVQHVRDWQQETFTQGATYLKAQVDNGAIAYGSQEYREKVSWLANLTGGAATYDTQMAKLKAMGL